MSESKVDTAQTLKQRRAGHLSDVTKRKNLCDEAFFSGSSSKQELQALLDAYEKAFAKFVIVHEKYVALEDDVQEQDKASKAYEFHRDTLLKMQIELSKRLSRNANSTRTSTHRSGSSARSRSEIAQLKLLEADIRLKALHEQQRLEIAEADIRRQRELLEAQTLRQIAEQSVRIADQNLESCASVRQVDVARENEPPIGRSLGTAEPSIQTLEAIASSIRQSLSLPSIELLRFSGDPLEYAEFMMNFKSHIESNVADPTQRLTRLLAQCDGKAKEAVRSCVTLPPNEGYETAKRTLYDNFGRPYMVANSHIKKMKDLRVKRPDAVSLLEFARALESTSRALKSLGGAYAARLDNDDFIKLLMKKLPSEPLKRGWCKRAGSLIADDVQVSLRHFIDFVSEIGTQLNNIYAEELDAPRKIVATVTSENSNCAEKKKIPCVVCGQAHRIWNCSQFKEMAIPRRWEIIKQHKLCISCLGAGHVAAKCKKHFKCRVSCCDRSHHTLLHNSTKINNEEAKRDASRATRDSPPNLSETSGNSVQSSDQTFNCCSGRESIESVKKVCFKIVPVRVRGSKGDIETYAFLDSGSDVTLCLDSLIDELGIPHKSASYEIQTISGTKQVSGKEVCLALDSIDGHKSFLLDKVLTSDSIPVDESNLISASELSNWPHLQGLQLHHIPRGEVTMLIGLDHPEIVEHQSEIRKGKGNGPIAVKTPFGWTVCGKIGNSFGAKPKMRVNFATTDFERRISQQLDKLYNTEFYDSIIDEAAMSTDDVKAEKIMMDSAKRSNGHYEISLPFKDGAPSSKNNFTVASKRLGSLKRRLEHDERLKTSYFNVLKQYEREGASRMIASSVDDLSKEEVSWYLPHHGVWTAKKPDEPRVVFDCAAKFEGISLNDQLYKGPENTNSLVGVLLRFRVGKTAVVADIKRMFHQVYVPEEERSVLRYLWWTDLNFDREPSIFEMMVHLFGATSSPSVCCYALRRTAEDNKEKYSTTAQKAVKTNFYVDDFVASFDNETIATDVCHEVANLVGEGGFRLTKWNANSRVVIESFPQEERAAAVKDLDLTFGDQLDGKILGIQWNLQTDLLKMTVRYQEFPKTRRGVLSSIAVVYDPLGIASPFLLPGREIHQELCRRNISWDEVLPDDLAERWEAWLKGLYTLVCEIPRCFLPEFRFEPIKCELHNFAAASESHGYGTVSYLRLVDEDGNVHCSFVYGKSRVRPLRQGVTVPKMELTAASVLVSISCMLEKELQRDLKIDNVFFWTDSLIVLCYLKMTGKRFDKFVANRVARILEGSTPQQWHHVSSKENPADLASRGIRPYQDEKVEKWLNGPEFLRNSSETWNEESDPVFETKTVSAVKAEACDFWKTLIDRYSSWVRLSRVVARLYEAVRKWKQFRRANQSTRREISPVLVEDVNTAEQRLVSVAQESLWDRQKDLNQLRVENINGYLCVGGRLTNSHISDQAKHPMILPSDHRVTHLLIVHAHQSNGHLGINYTLSKLREKFWVLKGVATVKKVLRTCYVCRRMHGKMSEQLLASLPSARVNIEHPENRFPFSSVGVDCFGPFHVTFGPRTRGRKGTHKRYGCIFTCLRTRAVHLEVLRELSSDCFLEAVTRFIARRGPPYEFFSDNGTNFKGASASVIEALKSLNHSSIQNRLANQKIAWHFNTPAASHQGGIWERIIRSIRRILDSLISNMVLTDETLSTVFCEVERILNDRPLTKVSSDSSDLEALTPNHLLLLRKNSSIRMGGKDECWQRGRWKQAKDIANQFWHRWVSEYLPTLQTRQKWLNKKRNLKKGDLVLIMDGKEVRGHWKKGLVMEAFEDREGYVRRVLLKVEDGTLLRNVQKLCLLEEELLSSSE